MGKLKRRHRQVVMPQFLIGENLLQGARTEPVRMLLQKLQSSDGEVHTLDSTILKQRGKRARTRTGGTF
jgi:hypothetical protein